MATQVTQDIRISVKAVYSEEQSDPKVGRFLFSYRIRIENRSARTVQLLRAQGHAEAEWADLVALWSRYNLHIARVMDRVPEAALHLPRSRHRPLGSTYAPLPADGVPSLHWLMRDYVAHIWHHLGQIDPSWREIGD